MTEQALTLETSKAPPTLAELLHRNGILTADQVKYAKRVRAKLRNPAPLLKILKQLNYVTDEQVQTVVRDNIGEVRIGDLLVELGLIHETDLAKALKIQAGETPKKKLGEVLIAHHMIEESRFVEALSLQMGFTYVEPEFDVIGPDLFSRAPTKWYKEFGFVPVKQKGDATIIAFSDPLDSRSVNAAKEVFGENIIQAIATKKSITQAIERSNKGSKTVTAAQVSGSRVVEIVDSILQEAIRQRGVSDIHIEPMPDRLRVRFRLDGVLIQHRDFPLELIPGISSRVKILCGADIAEKRRHQGGRIMYEIKGKTFDLRASFYITIHGEKIVLRLLNRQSELLSITDVGMAPTALKRFRGDALDCPSGVVLVTGPTGSGKTTTVYSCINYLNNPQTSIITAEEPVEYIIEGISQCSINPKIDLTFHETLRHIVRQDPDIIVIGEIRDQYSAEVAVQAALTGHKVVTTFHTEDSIGGLIRLLNMDIDAFLISSTVVCVLAQRLLRRICPDCAQSHVVTPEELLRLGYDIQEVRNVDFRSGRGCPTCRHTGYLGRIAVFEMLVLNEPVRDALLEKKTSHQIRRISIESTGLVTLLEDGIVKAARGLTSIEEVLRMLPRLLKPRSVEELIRLSGE